MLSQGTSTFLLCFAGFWLVWAFIITTCCFCSFVRRRLKRESEERLREQCLRDLHPPPPHLSPPHREPCPLQFCPPVVHRLSLSSPPPPVTPGPLPHPLPQANWVTMPDVELSGGRPPCYEEALLMDDPPPPYSEVLLAEPLGGPPPLRTTQVLPLVPMQHPNPPPPSSDTSKPPPPPPSPGGGPRLVVVGSPERGGHYDSLVPLPSLHHGSNHRDSLGRLLASMDISRHHQHHPHHQHHQDGDPLSFLSSTLHSTMPHLQDGGRTHRDQLALRAGGQGKQVMQGLRGLEPGCGLPTAFPLLGRSTAV